MHSRTWDLVSTIYYSQKTNIKKNRGRGGPPPTGLKRVKPQVAQVVKY